MKKINVILLSILTLIFNVLFTIGLVNYEGMFHIIASTVYALIIVIVILFISKESSIKKIVIPFLSLAILADSVFVDEMIYSLIANEFEFIAIYGLTIGLALIFSILTARLLRKKN